MINVKYVYEMKECLLEFMNIKDTNIYKKPQDDLFSVIF